MFILVRELAKKYDFGRVENLLGNSNLLYIGTYHRNSHVELSLSLEISIPGYKAEILIPEKPPRGLLLVEVSLDNGDPVQSDPLTGTLVPVVALESMDVQVLEVLGEGLQRVEVVSLPSRFLEGGDQSPLRKTPLMDFSKQLGRVQTLEVLFLHL